ncbi:MAG: hypothetical protein O7D31_00675, partial [Alphaproteobacteria bacterium]|nr:hypothetical protein [Alphaproteobacteria bacterium]
MAQDGAQGPKALPRPAFQAPRRTRGLRARADKIFIATKDSITMSRKCALAVAGLVRVITLPIMKWNRVSTLAQASERLVPRVKVRTRRGELLFYTPSKTAIYWPRHGFAAEPQTLEWIDTIGGGDVLWDVGANVGAYALYAAKIPGIT